MAILSAVFKTSFVTAMYAQNNRKKKYWRILNFSARLYILIRELKDMCALFLQTSCFSNNSNIKSDNIKINFIKIFVYHTLSQDGIKNDQSPRRYYTWVILFINCSSSRQWPPLVLLQLDPGLDLLKLPRRLLLFEYNT